MNFQTLAELHDYRAIGVALVEAERARGVHDIEALRLTPEEEISSRGEVQIRLEVLPDESCPVAGYYDHRERAIVLHPSRTATRDRFTVLHELGHHVQRLNQLWADVWCMLPAAIGEQLNERVADAFAAEILIPSTATELKASDVTARDLLASHQRFSTASRSALAHHALRDASPSDDVIVVVCDRYGEVRFARSVGHLWAPRSGAVQPGFLTLIADALRGSGHASGRLVPGLIAASGNVQDDLVADLAFDEAGEWAFVVIRLAFRFAPPSWVDRTMECPSAACGEAFAPDSSMSCCPKCDTIRCPHCGSCACVNNPEQPCPSCHMAYSAAELAHPERHECW
ncbi:ImmA/IrrE family metallo-endopeptidase [Oerskovia enterophila]|uniref:ImmA/IrrE family metallo-endopeptidase n=1 Tax=Oerskovia enterophila TaxID=43678 RepID=UPI0018D4C2A9|nr:ImmA/IrrE family metallo-endopeptidase [Oerskovia enterophila]